MGGALDLAASPARHRRMTAEVCIVGAGAAGIYLASRLARSRVDVLLIEAGGTRGETGADAGFDVAFEADRYSGAIDGRFFGLGGSTNRWGGLLAPHTSLDVRAGEPSSYAWSRIVDTVRDVASDVLADLGYDKGNDFESCAGRLCGTVAGALDEAGIGVLAALHMPFRRKNFAAMLGAASRLASPPTIVTGAAASSWTVESTEAGARVSRLTAVARNGNELSITARRFVVAAGAIEAARLLLELDDAHPQGCLRAGTAPGRYLTDHLSLPIAVVEPGDRARAAALLGPRFTGAWMRSFRLLDKRSDTTPVRSFTHLSFKNESRGFAIARDCLQAVQQRRLPTFGPKDALAGAAELGRLAVARVARSRLHIPKDTHVELQLDIEQVPLRQNGISLLDERDACGRRMPSIRWTISDMDMRNIEAAARRMLAIWPGRRAGLPGLTPIGLSVGGIKPFDAYHPTGTCRMGEGGEAVVDGDLKVRGTENVYVASTGVLPSAGTANPTFTMLCLTRRLGEHLTAAIARQTGARTIAVAAP